MIDPDDSFFALQSTLLLLLPLPLIHYTHGRLTMDGMATGLFTHFSTFLSLHFPFLLPFADTIWIDSFQLRWEALTTCGNFSLGYILHYPACSHLLRFGRVRIGSDRIFGFVWLGFFVPFSSFKTPPFLMRVAGFNIWVAAAIVGREESTPPRAAGTDTMGD